MTQSQQQLKKNLLIAVITFIPSLIINWLFAEKVKNNNTISAIFGSIAGVSFAVQLITIIANLISLLNLQK